MIDRCILVAAAMLLVVGVSPLAAETLRVPSQFATLRAALEAAVDGDEILVADGVYSGPDNRDLNTLGKAVVLRSENGPESCVIDCEGQRRALSIVSAEGAGTVIEGITLRNGQAATGGALLCIDSSPIIRNCRFLSNYALDESAAIATGGGMLIIGGTPVIEDSMFVANAGRIGGAIAAVDAQIAIRHCEFEFHHWPPIVPNAIDGTSGGAVALVTDQGTLAATFSDCRFLGNQAETGGAVQIAVGSAIFDRCIFDSNRTPPISGGIGGTIHATSASVVMRECEVVRSPVDAIISSASAFDILQSRFQDCSSVLTVFGSPTIRVFNSVFVGSGPCVLASGGQVQIQNSLFSSGRPGPVLMTAGSVSIVASNCTFVGNAVGSIQPSIAEVWTGSAVISNSVL